MKLTNTPVNAALELILEERKRFQVAIPALPFCIPTGRIVCLAIRAEERDEATGIKRIELKGSVVRRARDNCPADPSPIQPFERGLRRMDLHRIEVIVNVAIEQRDFLRCMERQR